MSKLGIKLLFKDENLSTGGILARNRANFLSNQLKLNEDVRSTLKNLKEEPQHLSEGGDMEEDTVVKEEYDSEPKNVDNAAMANLVSSYSKKDFGKKRARSNSSSSDTDDNLVPEKKKWKVELTDSQLEMLLSHADFKGKIKNKLKRKASVKRLNRNAKKLSRRRSKYVETDSDDDDKEAAAETLPLPPKRDEDVMVAIDDILADKPVEVSAKDADGKTPVKTPVKLTWLKKARVLDDAGRKRISEKFSAELEELSGIVNLLTKFFCYKCLLFISQDPLLRHRWRETLCQSFSESSPLQVMTPRQLRSRIFWPKDLPHTNVELPAVSKKARKLTH